MLATVLGSLVIAGMLTGEAPGDLTVTYDGQTAEVQREDYMLPTLPVPDEERLAKLIDRLDKQFSKPPRNAVLDSRGSIVPEQSGYRLDRTAFTVQFYSYFFGNGPAFIEAPVLTVHPRVDGELLAQIKEKPIGHYITYYNAGNRSRSYNIALAARAVNNTVVFPGETFSFNGVVGKRTKQRGYLQAPIIVRGELSEGIGGGICQVSSTLFNAADRAGLQIVKRYSHSRRVPYVLPGRDATVSWGGPDFAFRNPYSQPILLRASAAGGRMYAAVYTSEAIRHRPRKVPSVSAKIPEEAKHHS